MGTTSDNNLLWRSLGGVRAVIAMGTLAVVVGCQGRQTRPIKQVPATKSTLVATPTEAPSAALPSRRSDGRTVDAPGAVTIAEQTHATSPDAATQAQQSAALRATVARIDVLSAKAAEMVRKIEARPPDRIMLLRLDAAFTDARRLMTTDQQLAALGEKLSATEKKAAHKYSKALYEKLKARIAAAGKRHRAAAKRPVNGEATE